MSRDFNQNLELLEGELEFYEEEEERLLKLAELISETLFSIHSIYDQQSNNMLSFGIEGAVYLSELLINLYELNKIQKELNRELDGLEETTFRLRRRIQKAKEK